MKNKIICLILSLIFFPSANATECSISSDEENNLLTMSFDQFDQSKEGWRHLDGNGCYQQIAALIDRYTNQNETKINEWQKRILFWHAGQLYAFNNEYSIAKQHFLNAIDPNETSDSFMRWNDYAYATIAFLDHDLYALQQHRENIAIGPELNGKKPNLDVIDNLIKYFDEPYSVAYSKNR